MRILVRSCVYPLVDDHEEISGEFKRGDWATHTVEHSLEEKSTGGRNKNLHCLKRIIHCSK